MIGVLLQQNIEFFSAPDPQTNRITLIVFGALVVVGVLAALINARRGKGGSGRTRVGLGARAKRLGLSSDQRKALREMARSLSLKNPDRMLTNPSYLDHAMRRRIEQIDSSDQSEAVREQQKSMLFTIKKTIQNASASLKVLPSTHALRAGTVVQIRTADKVTFRSAVSSNVHNGLGIELPANHRGGSWRKGATLQVSVVADQNRLYTFRTRIVGLNSARGASVMFVQHATNVRQTQKRRSPRREYDRPCYFYPVTVITVGKGKKAKRQAFVNKNRRIFGQFEDLSGGGCAIRTQAPLTTGSILKVDFDLVDGTSISVFGKVRHVDRHRGRGRVMHIMFTRVSRKSMNQIQSYVYGLVEAS